jgi:spermidine synthase
MKPWELIGETTGPDGTTLTLMRQDREYVILAGGKSLMSSRMHGSEEALALLGCRQARMVPAPHVLVGGLGMGFTLRATLDVLPRGARVTVSELLPDVIEWNRGPLAPLAGHPLDDARVSIDPRDVAMTIRENPGRFDAVLLDVDNGPSAFTSTENAGLYSNDGIAASRAALVPGGVLAVWSSRDDRKFEQRLRYHGFAVTVAAVRGRLKKGGPRHTIFVGVTPDATTCGSG